MRYIEIDDLACLWRRSRIDALPELEARLGHSLEEDIEYFRGVVVRECEIWVGERRGRPIGFVALQGGVLEKLYVDPSEQGTGVGSELLAKAKTIQPYGLRLSTHQINRRARGFYERRGFRAVGFGISPPPESEPDVAYEWTGPSSEHAG